MGIFESKQNSFIGIDLSQDSIKIVELTLGEGNKPLLVTYAYTDAPSQELSGDFITNKNVTSTVIKEMCQRAKASSVKALAALPVSRVFTSIINLYNLSRSDLADARMIKAKLAEEARKLLPMPLEKMFFDYTMINHRAVEKQESSDAVPVKFLITAAANDVVKQYVDIITQSGLQLTNLDVEPFALVRSLIGTDPSLILIVDIGENTTELNLIDDGTPIINRSIQVGSGAVSKQIASALSIPLAQAEQYKKDLGVLSQQQQLTDYPQPIKQGLQPIIAEIKYVLKSYQEQFHSDTTIDKIILSGGGALLAQLDTYLAKELNIRTYVGDPWARVIYPQELQGMLKLIGPRFAVAIGLAMRELGVK